MITQRFKWLTLLTLLLVPLLTLNHLDAANTSDAHRALDAHEPQGEVNIEYVGHIGGFTSAVFVQGNYAYIGEGPRGTAQTAKGSMVCLVDSFGWLASASRGLAGIVGRANLE